MKLLLSNRNGVPISQDMYGLFFEDINYSLDGGLYAEMLENRNFEALFTYGKKDDYTSVYDGGYAWNVYGGNGSGSFLVYDSTESLNEMNPHYLIFTGCGRQPAFTNKAYDGIYLERGAVYRVSFYAWSESASIVTVSIRKNDRIYLQGTVEVDGTNWKKYEMLLTAEETTEQADFVVTLDKEGTVAFDQFSMMPVDAICGVFRKDLVEKLVDLNPSFLRFPGGCIVEGNTLENRYKWKDTIAPIEERRFNWNRWAVHNGSENTDFTGAYAHYGQTYGVGFYEYFLLCEYLHAKALPVVSVGLACQFMSTEQVEPDSEQMQEYIQDALDLIEFANGSMDTVWGRKRAEMGHPEPFHLEYLGIGNEQWQTQHSKFFERYTMFEREIHARYPMIKLIGSAGPDVWSENYRKAWEWIKKVEKKNFVYALDEHYYASEEWLFQNHTFYDNYDRNIKVFAGEYACHLKDKGGRMNYPAANTLGAALAEAAFMTGVERNADVVVMASYAPLFARLGYTQWSPDLIWFNGKSSYCTPSYYVQALFSKYRGSRTLCVELCSETPEEQIEIFASAVKDEEGNIIIKLVNATERDVELSLEGEYLQCENISRGSRFIISGCKEDTNTIEEPDRISIQQEKIISQNGKIMVSKNSIQAIVVPVN